MTVPTSLFVLKFTIMTLTTPSSCHVFILVTYELASCPEKNGMVDSVIT